VTREVTLYTRRDCGLCDETAEALRRLAPGLRFTLTERDVDADAALRDRYNEIVPVVVVAGRVVAAAPVDPRTLESALAAALG
jgi:predicted thioredoxin/glutaredoxin